MFHLVANISCCFFLNVVLTLGFALVMAVVNERECYGGWLYFDLVVGNTVFVVLVIGSIVYGAFNVLDLLVCGL